MDGQTVLTDVPFSAVSDYLCLSAGSHRISPAGAASPVVIDATVTFAPGGAYTVAATGLLSSNDLQVLVLADDLGTIPSQAKVRFVHTSPDAPAVDIAVSGGPVLFSNVSFRGASAYAEVSPGTYDLEVRLAGTSTVALALPGVALSAGTNATSFAIGQVGDGSLSALPAEDRP